MARRNRRNLPYRPVPIDLRRRRRIAPDYANAYVQYRAKTGVIKRSSFKVAVDPNKHHMVMHKLIRHLCNKIKNNQIPIVPNGYKFDDFGDLFIATPWMRVRKILVYRVGMVYEK